MHNKAELLRAPWTIEQKDSGNCGFVVVLTYLAVAQSPFLNVLERDLFAGIGDTSESKTRASIQRRLHLHLGSKPPEGIRYPNTDIGDDYDWYMATALTVHFKKYCKLVAPEVLHECEELSRTLAPTWETGPRLKPLEARIREDALDLSSVYTMLRTIHLTFKGGSLAISLKGMSVLLTLVNAMRISDAFTAFSYQTENYNRLQNELFSPTPADRASSLAKHQEFISILDRLRSTYGSNFAAIVGIKYIKLLSSRSTQFTDEYTHASMHHWIYVCCLPAGEYEYWTNKKRYKIARNALNLLRAEIILLPYAVYPLQLPPPPPRPSRLIPFPI